MLDKGHSKLAEYLREKSPPPKDGNSNNEWRVTLKEGERKTQKMESPVGLSRAYLKPSSDKGGDGLVSVMIQRGNDAESLLCTLSEKNLWKSIATILSKGEQVTFSIKGKGIVRLTGLLLLDDDNYSDIASDDSDEFVKNEEKHSEKGNEFSGSKKRKNHGPVKDSKKSRLEVEEGDDTDDDTDADTDADIDNDSDEYAEYDTDEDEPEIYGQKAYEEMTFSSDEDGVFDTSH